MMITMRSVTFVVGALCMAGTAAMQQNGSKEKEEVKQGGQTEEEDSSDDGQQQMTIDIDTIDIGIHGETVTAGRQEAAELLFKASEKGDVRVAKQLLQRADARELLKSNPDYYGQTPLHFAALHGHTEVVQFFLGAKVDVDVLANYYGRTPLHYAASFGHADVCKVLLGGGANKDAKSKSGWTPLMQAAYTGHLEVVQLLVEAGADTAAKKDGKTAEEMGKGAVAAFLRDVRAKASEN